MGKDNILYENVSTTKNYCKNAKKQHHQGAGGGKLIKTEPEMTRDYGST